MGRLLPGAVDLLMAAGALRRSRVGSACLRLAGGKGAAGARRQGCRDDEDNPSADDPAQGMHGLLHENESRNLRARGKRTHRGRQLWDNARQTRTVRSMTVRQLPPESCGIILDLPVVTST